MAKTQRNRSQGWTWAKMSGHSNEELLAKLLQQDSAYKTLFLKRIGKDDCDVMTVSVGGLHEGEVCSVLNDNIRSRPKTDMWVGLTDGSEYHFSIKKSLPGQVSLITVPRFINGFQAQYQKVIPQNVQKAITLYWGTDSEIKKYIEKYGSKTPKVHAYEIRKHRLTGDSLQRCSQEYFDCLIEWFKDNIVDVTDFCFAKGTAKDGHYWSNYVWYKNMFQEHDIDEIIPISTIKEKAFESRNEKIFYGSRNEKTTIQLPFGFVQWHKGDMQFHHNYLKIKDLLQK